MILFEVRTSDDGKIWKKRGTFLDMWEAEDFRSEVMDRCLKDGQFVAIAAIEYPKRKEKNWPIRLVWESEVWEVSHEQACDFKRVRKSV